MSKVFHHAFTKRGILMKTVRFFVGIAIVAIVVFSCSLPAYAQKVTKKNVPTVVISAFEKSYPSAKVKGYSKEMEGDKVSYEIECMVGAVHHDVSYYADGSLVVDEASIKIAELPEAVMKAIQATYPKCRIQSSEKLTSGSGVGYEVIVKSGKKIHEMEFDASGKVVNTEEKTGKSEKD
jgi:hypothetical protein